MDFFRSNNDEHQLNIETAGNPTYEQNNMQSTQSNSNSQGTHLPEAHYLIPIKVKSNTLTNTCTLQVNDTSDGVPSFIYQDDLQMEGVYSLADDRQTEESLYNQLRRN